MSINVGSRVSKEWTLLILFTTTKSLSGFISQDLQWFILYFGIWSVKPFGARYKGDLFGWSHLQCVNSNLNKPTVVGREEVVGKYPRFIPVFSCQNTHLRTRFFFFVFRVIDQVNYGTGSLSETWYYVFFPTSLSNFTDKCVSWNTLIVV